jgi:hypothetical protein
MRPTTLRLRPTLALQALALWALSPVVLAHEGHGLLGTHWHATDTFGFLALGAVVVGVGIWLSGRK